jgi:propanol-preferring alcohol dehydrogenase
MGVLGNVTNFPTFEERIVKGSVIGSRKDMADLLSLASDSNLKVMIEKRRLAEANEVLVKLKKSQIEARAVLVP